MSLRSPRRVVTRDAHGCGSILPMLAFEAILVSSVFSMVVEDG
jgi:hypothetical protein